MKSLTLFIFLLMAFVNPSYASGSDNFINIHETSDCWGFMSLAIFFLSYILVMAEEITHLRKSKPVIVAAGIIWILIAYSAAQKNLTDNINLVLRHYILEYAELFLFLLCAMTYVNAMEERMVFEKLRSWLIQRGYSYKKLFWVTGFLAFFISPIADNLTTALLMCAVIMAVGAGNPKFISLSCINIVIAANAGGAFSPFGDITTLMVWQKGILKFHEFFSIFIPSLVSYLVPAGIICMALDDSTPEPLQDKVKLRFGAIRVILLFLATITLTVTLHNFLHLPPALGMMTGLGVFMFFSFFIRKYELKKIDTRKRKNKAIEYRPFDIFNKIKRAEWDTLFFFYGVILSVGGLAVLGYLDLLSQYLYNELGKSLSTAHTATPANIIIGLLSAIVDNIPVMFGILTMNPDMSHGQWLLATLTTGIGGSLLSIGSAAGVALMGQARGTYTFISHLKWSWVILLGYAAGIYTHIWLNDALFYVQISTVGH